MSYDPGYDEKDEGPKEPERVLTVLAVLSSEDDNYPLDKLLSSKDCNDLEKEFIIKMTTFEKFKADKLEDTFDCVVLTFMTSVTTEDLQIKKDYYDYYTQVPLVHYAVV